MKLRQRVLITISGIIFLGIFYVAIYPIPVTFEIDTARSLPNISSRDASKIDSSKVQWVHMSPLRKRLNKSNYSSDNISPEGVRNRKEFAKTRNAELFLNGSATESQAKSTLKSNKLNSNHSSENATLGKDSIVEELLQLLYELNKEKFNFTHSRKHGYNNSMRSHRKRKRRRGFGLPVYRNYGG